MNDEEEERRRRDEPTTTLFGVIAADDDADERGTIAATGGLALAVLAPRSTRDGLAASLSAGEEARAMIIVYEGGRLFANRESKEREALAPFPFSRQ